MINHACNLWLTMSVPNCTCALHVSLSCLSIFYSSESCNVLQSPLVHECPALTLLIMSPILSRKWGKTRQHQVFMPLHFELGSAPPQWQNTPGKQFKRYYLFWLSALEVLIHSHMAMLMWTCRRKKWWGSHRTKPFTLGWLGRRESGGG